MNLTLIDRALAHGERTAIVDTAGAHTYRQLLRASASMAAALLGERDDLAESRVACFVAPGLGYAAAQWGIWRAGGIAVPLCLSHPAPELDYVLGDTGASIVVADVALADRVRPLVEARGARLVLTERAIGEEPARPFPDIEESRRALILYTSGTTSRPKGVVLTHTNLRAGIESLVEAWAWSAGDRIAHVLPLHHTHGIVNALLCALWSGATCEMHPSFDAGSVWTSLASGQTTLFMAVPTVYVKLIAAWDAAPDAARARWSRARSLRLMVSGSAALPVSVFERWREITGHALLERYGMTEIGMALSNPLRGERRPGTVGQPLPGVEANLVDELGTAIEQPATPGEIEIRGPAVFAEYWGRPDATRDAFRDGWFRTGDVAVIENSYWRILGRSSIDIIKTGGYKVSALEIEETLREHPEVRDCAVVGLADAEWGERVAAAVVAMNGDPSPDLLRAWLAERLASYKVPRSWRVVADLPRNAMGKVVKTKVKEMFD